MMLYGIRLLANEYTVLPLARAHVNAHPVRKKRKIMLFFYYGVTFFCRLVRQQEWHVTIRQLFTIVSEF